MFKWQFFVSFMWVLCAASVYAEESLTNFFTFLPLDAQTKTWLADQKEHDDPRLIKDIPLALLREQQPYNQCKRQEIDTIQMFSIEVLTAPFRYVYIHQKQTPLLYLSFCTFMVVDGL